MKKLAIVALVLVAMSFVGCGLNSQLIGTWEREWADGAQGDSWEFKRNNECVYSYYVNGNLSGSTTTYDWVVEEDIVTLSILGVEIYEFRVDITGSEMKMYYLFDDDEETEDDFYWTYTKK